MGLFFDIKISLEVARRRQTIFKMTKVYVGKLNYKAEKEDVEKMFEQYGPIEEVVIPTERETGRPRGFAFITYANEADAKDAIEGMNGKNFMDFDLQVNVARPRESGGGGYGGGGSGGSGGGGRSGGGYGGS